MFSKWTLRSGNGWLSPKWSVAGLWMTFDSSPSSSTSPSTLNPTPGSTCWDWVYSRTCMTRDSAFSGLIGTCGVNFPRGTEHHKDLDVMKSLSSTSTTLTRGFLSSSKSQCLLFKKKLETKCFTSLCSNVVQSSTHEVIILIS